jgi:hypothetical protein
LSLAWSFSEDGHPSRTNAVATDSLEIISGQKLPKLYCLLEQADQKPPGYNDDTVTDIYAHGRPPSGIITRCKCNSGTVEQLFVIQYFQRILYSTSSLLSEIDRVDSLDGLVACVNQIRSKFTATLRSMYALLVWDWVSLHASVTFFYRGESSCHCFEIPTIVRSVIFLAVCLTS